MGEDQELIARLRTYLAGACCAACGEPLVDEGYTTMHEGRTMHGRCVPPPMPPKEWTPSMRYQSHHGPQCRCAICNATGCGAFALTDRCLDCDGVGKYPSGAECKSCAGHGRVRSGDGQPPKE